MKHLLILGMLAVAPCVQATPFAKGNAEIGKKLHAQQCDGCHADKFNGNAAKIYTRADRKVKNPDHLAQRIGSCNAMLGLNLFPEDEANLGAYLNKTYYKFK